jgi:hypothetical protein
MKFFCELHIFLVAGVQFGPELDVTILDDFRLAKYDFGMFKLDLIANFDSFAKDNR